MLCSPRMVTNDTEEFTPLREIISTSESPCWHQEVVKPKRSSESINTSGSTDTSGSSSEFSCSSFHRLRRNSVKHHDHVHFYNIRERRNTRRESEENNCMESVKDTPSICERKESSASSIDGSESGEHSLSFLQNSTYFCEQHDPKPILQAENVQSNRIEISTCSEKRTGKRAVKGGKSSHRDDNDFLYQISIGELQHEFRCTPSDAREMYNALREDPKLGDQVQFVETHYLSNGLRGKLKRLWAGNVKISTEIMQVLESLGEIDGVLKHPVYLDTINAEKESNLHEEIDRLLHELPFDENSEQYDFYSQLLARTSAGKCMCKMYLNCVQRFGECCAKKSSFLRPESVKPARVSHLVSESLMSGRNALAFYTDTVFILDKREFEVTGGLKRCRIYGFGSHELFEIVRVSRRNWLFQLVDHGPIFRLTLRKYAEHRKMSPMVLIRRWAPKEELLAHRPEEKNKGIECVCFVEKCKSRYQCSLMSEVITQGKVTKSIRIKQSDIANSKLRHYVTASEISSTNASVQSEVCSSCLSVSKDIHKRIQWLHIRRGTDVLTYIAIAVSYDILVGKLSYWKYRKY
uniref:Uncharacterized protein AlNc14C15G1704 n=1 Tax=Albugo laibachii Nc14 TaxID=890382 RepID=F0W410_9STRA|nr:conserved hypothetical protein [Albugo laibachii Nc14]|eukprot:CCA15807.1 conserved hypothetical protein [Albugo laibachii Nc14]